MAEPTPRTTDPAPAARPRWRKLQLVVGVALLGVMALIFAARFVTRDDLPGCDSKRARDTLSNVFQANSLKPTRYNEVRTVSSGKDEVVCSATLATDGPGRIEVDYRFYKQDGQDKYQVTRLDSKT